VPVGTFTVHPYTHDKVPYDAERDLQPIASVTAVVLALSAAPNLPVRTLGNLVALACAQPGKLNAAAANGNAEFLLFGFLKSAGLDVPKVPYKDITQAPNDLAEGRIQVLMSTLVIVRPHLAAGRLKVLAVTSRARAPIAPEVPTVGEAGFPALQLESLIGVFGSRGMPLELRERIAADLRAVLAADPVIGERRHRPGGAGRGAGRARHWHRRAARQARRDRQGAGYQDGEVGKVVAGYTPRTFAMSMNCHGSARSPTGTSISAGSFFADAVSSAARNAAGSLAR
jgi:hypothetical protein